MIIDWRKFWWQPGFLPAIIAMTVVSLPQFIVAMVASGNAKKMALPNDPVPWPDRCLYRRP